MTVAPTVQTSVRVLLVEDSPSDVDLIHEALEEGALDPALDGPSLRLEQVDRLAAALERLATGEIDVLLLDLSLPDSHGIETFVRLRDASPGTPVVILSGLADEAMAIRAVREGAQDYLVKGQADGKTLTRSIYYAVERKHAEDERARLARASAEAAASLHARDETLAAISHDLRTPLTSIRGLAQLLKRRIERGTPVGPDELLDRLSRIEDQTDLMTRMIDDLLDVARLESGRPLELRREPCDLVDLVERCAADVQRTTSQHRLRVVVNRRPVVGALDATRLERVVQNLLTNAVKYSPDGGDVTVTIRPESGPPVGLSDDIAGPVEPEISASEASAVSGAWAALDVRDEGIGIPPEDLPRIFERFYRASNVRDQLRGTGLGLAGALQIVRQHGGTIDVTSVPGAGTTFTVRLPLSAPSQK